MSVKANRISLRENKTFDRPHKANESVLSGSLPKIKTKGFKLLFLKFKSSKNYINSFNIHLPTQGIKLNLNKFKG